MRKANHYVAQSLQRRFCDENGLIWVYDKETRQVRQQSPKTTAVETHLYTIETDDGGKSDILECKVFDPLDGEIVALIDRLVTPGYRMDKREIPNLAYYVSFQHARVPRNISMVKELGEAMALKLIKNLSADKEEMDEAYEHALKNIPQADHISREKYQNMFENFSDHYKFEVKTEFALAMTLRLSKDIFEFLVRMHWSIVDAPRDNYFITCDAPIVSIASVAPNVVQYGANFASPFLEIVFPISPSVCLWARKVAGQKRLKCSAERVEEFNRRTAFFAERYIFSHQDSQNTRSLLLQNAHTRNMPKINREYVNARWDWEMKHRKD
jgi:hypothetical protein